MLCVELLLALHDTCLCDTALFLLLRSGLRMVKQFLKFAHDFNLMPDLIGRTVLVRMISEVMAAR
jgi:hypothetical protein